MSSILANLKQITSKIRSKNAGPFWITIDIFFDADTFWEIVDLHNKFGEFMTKLLSKYYYDANS